jgi:Tfp pilus assembly protein PilX
MINHHHDIKKVLPVSTQKGFTLFVSLMLVSFVLAIGFSIGNIILKQLILSSSGGGSQIAFYAAGSAVECVRYWDKKNNAGDNMVASVFNPIAEQSPELNIVLCGNRAGGTDGQVYNLTKTCNVECGGPETENNISYATTTFYIDLHSVQDPEYKACAFVTVTKSHDPDTGSEDTVIETRGYNTELLVTGGVATGCNLSKARVVERGVRVTY